MMNCHICTSDEELAEASLFLLEHKRSLHPAYSTVDMISMLYTYIEQGHLVRVTDANQRTIGVAAYYIGTPEQEFQDREVALLDVAVAAPAYQGSRLFLVGLQYIVNRVVTHHPEVTEIRLAAQTANRYTCRLYGKFASVAYHRESELGDETVFSARIDEIMSFLSKYHQV